LYAFHEGTPDHDRYRDWLVSAGTSYEPLGLAEVVLSGFIRIATHPRIFTPPAPIKRAFEFANALLAQPSAVVVAPGARHWAIYEQLCVAAGAKGNLVSDAFIAALAIESGCELITTDRDFARFPGLRWRHPLAEGQS
jgi:toxin-antitoxin system PIN domain toxin